MGQAVDKKSCSILLVILMLTGTAICQDGSSDFYFTNLTSTPTRYEVNPRLIESGRAVLYLDFVGNPQAPQLWDYRLKSLKLESGETYSLPVDRVIDYNLSSEDQVLILRSNGEPENINPTCEFEFEEISSWEIVVLDLSTGSETHVASSNGRPVSEGYSLIGLTYYGASNGYQSRSPKSSREIRIERYSRNGMNFINYILNPEKRNQSILRTEAWRPYAHLNWLPPVIWLDDDNFVSVVFQADREVKPAQNIGSFSIIHVNCENMETKLLYRDADIHPFSKMTLAPSGSEILFLKSVGNKQISQFWRLNLNTLKVDLIYSVAGDLGQPRYSKDGTQIIFAQMTQNNSDIIYLDLLKLGAESVARN